MATNFYAVAERFRKLADEAEALETCFDDQGTNCPCCDAFRVRNFPQKQMRERVAGVVERLRIMADTVERRADDPEFTFLADLPKNPEPIEK